MFKKLSYIAKVVNDVSKKFKLSVSLDFLFVEINANYIKSKSI